MRSLSYAVVALGAMAVACAAPSAASAGSWQFSASVSYYDVPNSEDFWNPILTADHGRLHLEARHNYVTLGTTSFWAGANFGVGKDWRLDATAMGGIVWGTVDGIGAGYELTLTRKWFTLSSQGEYIYNPHTDQDDSLYSWTELTGSPAAWCRLGVVGQRTTNYGARPDIQRGYVAAFTYKKLDFEVDALDPGHSDETYILALTFSF